MKINGKKVKKGDMILRNVTIDIDPKLGRVRLYHPDGKEMHIEGLMVNNHADLSVPVDVVSIG